jgi:hypothetical protein
MSTRPTLKEIEMILTNAHMTLNGLEIRKCTPLLAVVIVRSTGSAKTNYINDVNVQKIMSSKLSAFTKIRTPKTIANTNKSGPKLQTYPPKRASR